MRKVRKSITIDDSILELIKQEAEKQRRSFSSMIELLCYSWLKINNKINESD